MGYRKTPKAFLMGLCSEKLIHGVKLKLVIWQDYTQSNGVRSFPRRAFPPSLKDNSLKELRFIIRVVK